MKKLLSIIVTLVLCLTLAGCTAGDTSSKGDANIQAAKFTQEVTIVKMPSPPKCKTTDNASIVNEVITVLSQIEKAPTESDVANGGWTIMVKLNVDGQELNYTIGSLFTDADGRQYKVTNYKEIEDKLTKIYNELDVPEVDYP